MPEEQGANEGDDPQGDYSYLGIKSTNILMASYAKFYFCESWE